MDRVVGFGGGGYLKHSCKSNNSGTLVVLILVMMMKLMMIWLFLCHFSDGNYL